MLTNLTPPPPAPSPDEQPTAPLTTIRAADSVTPRYPPVTLDTYARMVERGLADGRQAITADGDVGAFVELTRIPYEHIAPLAERYRAKYGDGHVRALTWLYRRTGYLKVWADR